MDLEDLNKTQIILLTLLVSFVSAIATSIFTVKILEEAPQAVTKTINRVVERTIERVVPAEPTETGKVEQTVIEKETTIVVKEEDLITESIEKNKRKIVRLVTVIPSEEPIVEGTSTPEIMPEYIFHGIGLIVSSKGLIATASQFADIDNLFAITSDGSVYKTSLSRDSGEMAVLQVEANNEEEVISLNPAVFADSNSLKLGQTVIALGGEERTNVSMGIIASLIDGEIVNSEESKSGLISIHTNISGSIPGSPIVNIFGEVVGIDLEGVPGLYTSSFVIRESLKEVALSEDNLESAEAQIDTISQEG